MRVAATATLLLLAACDGGGDPVQQALRDASAERQAVTIQDGETSGPGAVNPADARNVQRMIAQSEAALAAARVALAESSDPEVRRLAQSSVGTHTSQLTDLRAWKPAAN